MRRRALLGTLAMLAGTAGGCLGRTTQTNRQAGARAPRASIRMEPITDAGIAKRVYRAIRSDQSDRARVLADATTDGTATIRSLDPPIRDGVRVVYEGSVYAVSMTVTDRTPATVFPILLNDLAYDGVTVTADAGRIRFDELPAVDREALGEMGLTDGDPLGIGTNLVYTDAQIEQSVLVPSPEYRVIVWGPDRKGRFSHRSEPHDRTLSTYQYTAETVAESAAGHGAKIRADHTVDLSAVPESEAEILARAANGDPYTVAWDSTPSEAFRSLVDRFRGVRDVNTVRRDHEGDPATPTGAYLVSYDRTVYWTRVVVRPPERTTDGSDTTGADPRTTT